MDNGGVIITDFINPKKGKMTINWKGFNPGLQGKWKSLTQGGKKIVTLLNKIYTFLKT
jgi:hypothetical protein